MKLPSFLKRFGFKESKKQDLKPREKIVDSTATEIWKILHSWNYQWENFNKVVDYIEKIIVKVLENDMELLGLRHKVYVNNLGLALMMPWFMREEYLNSQMRKNDPELEKMHKENLVTRVSTDSLRRYYILNALDEILKISSAEEFWERNYKIWDIEIKSFEDLEQNRSQLQEMFEKFKNYDIPWYKEAVEYAAKNGINTNFYS